MPNRDQSAVYHLGTGRIPPGRLVHVEDRQGGEADIYLHPLHAREQLLWDLNWVTLQQVGYGLWRQRWTRGGRMLVPAEGLGVAVSRWEIVPGREMPRSRCVFPVEEDGSCIWLIRAGVCTRALQDAMNTMLERIAGDGLWLQAWSGELGRAPMSGLAPTVAPAARPIGVSR